MANVKIDNLADEIMNGLKEYADLATWCGIKKVDILFSRIS